MDLPPARTQGLDSQPAQTVAVDTYQTNRPTRLGIHFFIVGAFAMLGGSLKGLNLLLMLAAFIVAALSMHWRWTFRSIESISVARRLPTEAFAGLPFRVRYVVRNHARFMPAWMIRIEDKLTTNSHRRISATTACAAGVISPSTTVVPYTDVTVTRRGKYKFGPAALQTSFPFTMFLSRKTFVSYETLFVFPRLLSLSGSWHRNLPSRIGGVTTTARRSGAAEGEFFGLREWQTGDSLKWIHWRTSARLGEPAVRQFEQQRRFDLVIVVDAHADPGDSDGDAVEFAISLAATLVVHLVGSPSNRAMLAVADKHTDTVVGGGSQLGRRKMLEALAGIETVANPPVESAIEATTELLRVPQDVIVVSSRSLRAAMGKRQGLERLINLWKRRGSFQWIDVNDRDVKRWATVPRQMDGSLEGSGQRSDRDAGIKGTGGLGSRPLDHARQAVQ